MADFEVTVSGSNMFRLAGELDLATVPLLDVAIGGSVDRGGSITLDMADVTFADSAGIGAILRAANVMPAGCVVLHGIHGGIGKVIDIMGVGRRAPNLHVIPCLHPGQGGSRD